MKLNELLEASSNFKKFPDTKQGVISFMKDSKEVDQSFVKEIDLDSCVIHADPQVEGVWAIDSMKTGIRVIVYLGGYRDPWGKIRPNNDFEEGEMTKRDIEKYFNQGKISEKDYKKISKNL